MFIRQFLFVTGVIILLQHNKLIAAPLEAPILGNIAINDANGDGSFETITSTTKIHVWWRNVNYLNQRWARRSAIEIDLSTLPANAIVNSAILTIKPIQKGSSASGPDFEFYGYSGDGTLQTSDALQGDTLIDTITLIDLLPFSIDITNYVQSLIDTNETVLGVNIRALDEGKIFNTFDEEFESFGYTSTSTVFPGPKLLIDYTMPADGDINSDGSVNAADVLLAIRHIQRFIVLTPEQISRGDLYPTISGDGVIDISDYILIQKKVLSN